ncbi:hypothetical protein [Williamsia sterculiae]|uniref:HNH endonuclease n=1 Tax=Williamsia sterculiae TaxID=1344003 RepID=A0A1N7FW15_9NOCA|nr:hypothetical protein [Williamsia sterculiae]SIS04542.1 hypothetical protein SAMN05445060_2342 [Williamsia sterculiae]
MVEAPESPASRRRMVGVVMLLLALLLPLSTGVSAAAPDGDQQFGFCAAQRQRVAEASRKTDEHNARPHDFLLPDQQGAYDAYNAEAAAGNAENAAARSALLKCLQAISQLTGQGTSGYDVSPVSPEARRVITSLQQLTPVPAGWTPPTVPSGQRWTVPGNSPVRPYYDVLRRGNPPTTTATTTFQGIPRPRAGDPDPAFPGRSIGGTSSLPKVSADHIVPLSEIVNLPGYAALTPTDMYVVSRAPLNLQWLSQRANVAKNSGLARRVVGADEAWVEEQDRLYTSVREQLIALISQLNGS